MARGCAVKSLLRHLIARPETLLGSLFGVGAVYFISFLLLFLP